MNVRLVRTPQRAAPSLNAYVHDPTACCMMHGQESCVRVAGLEHAANRSHVETVELESTVSRAC